MNASTHRLESADARGLLLLQCLEDADPAGRQVPLEVRADASKSAGDLTGTGFLRARAEALAPKLPADWAAAVRDARTGGEFRAGRWAWPIAAAAFAIGWSTNSLGPGRTVNLLAFPLLGLILWNLAVCGAAAVAEVRRSLRAAKKPPAPREAGPVAAWLAKRMAGRGSSPADPDDAWMQKVRAAFALRWQEIRLPGILAVATLTFHAAAIALAAGVVAGMYARGLGRDYRAAWESTFLDRPGVTRLLHTALGPASLVTGIRLPDVPAESEPADAAPWIHLWAASAGLFIFLPRLLLMAGARRDLGRAQPDWDRVFLAWEERNRVAAGRTPVAVVVPLQTSPDAKTRDSLRRVLQQLWGGHVVVDFTADVPYGDEEEFVEAIGEIPSHLVLLWPFAATPETEIHGQTVKALAGRLADSSSRALVVLETSGFDARMAALPEFARRTAERRAAWEKILGGALPVLLLDARAAADPAAAAASVPAATEPVRNWTGART